MTRYVTRDEDLPAASVDSTIHEEERYEIRILCECERCDGRGKVVVDLQEPPVELTGVVRERCPECRGEGKKLSDPLATCGSPEALGLALVTLAREGEFTGCSVHILDRLAEVGKKVIINGFMPSPRNLGDAGRLLGRRSGEKRRERGKV